MTASVTSGFAPAALSIVTTGTASAAAPAGDVAEPGLFAALLSLLGPQPTPESETPAAAPADAAVPRQAAVLPETATVTPLIAINDRPPMQTEQGKSLLKNLGDALIAINDALDVGKPVDPALAKKLGDALDAVAVYLGTFAPPAPQIDPRITALASGEGILPQTPAVLPAAPAIVPSPEGVASSPEVPTAPGEVAAPEGDVPAPVAAAASIVPAPSAVSAPAIAPAPAEAPAIAIAVAADAAPDAPTPAPAAPANTGATAPAPSTDEPPAPPAPAPLAKLGQLVEDLGKKLAAQSPELAAKLDTLAKSLKNGVVPSELVAGLAGDAAADPEIARIIEALTAPKPAAKAPAAQPFVAPSLVVPEAVAKSSKPEPAATPAPEVALSDTAEASATRDPDSVRRTVVINIKPDQQPAEPDAKPAPTASQQTAAPASTPDTTAPAPAPLLAAGAVAAARTIHAAYQAPVQQVNLPQVAFEVVRQFEAGNSRFQIRLDPAELGRIDVRLDVDKSGAVSARMTVERPETLDLLQRDQRALQQALQQAGLDGQKTNLEFSLRQNPFAQHGGMGDGRGDHPGFNGRGDGFAGSDDTAAEAATTTYRGTASASGLNLFV